MGDLNDMNIVVRVSAHQHDLIKRMADRKGEPVGDFAGKVLSGILAGYQPDLPASQAPSFEDVRLMVREEIRAALAELFMPREAQKPGFFGGEPMPLGDIERQFGGSEWSAEEQDALRDMRARMNERRNFGPRPEALQAPTMGEVRVALGPAYGRNS